MSTDVRVVETDHGKEVRMPYHRACQSYVFGWIVATWMTALLFLYIYEHALVTGRLEDAALLFATLWSVVGVALVNVRRYRPVQFYEMVEQ